MEIQSLSSYLTYPRSGAEAAEADSQSARTGHASPDGSAEESDGAPEATAPGVVGQAYTAAGRHIEAEPERVGISVLA